MKLIQCPLINNHIISPAVGVFYRANYADKSPGCIRQLGETLVLTIPGDFSISRIVQEDGAFVMVGDCIAECGQMNAVNTTTHNIVKSPSDGFISTVDGTGTPFVESGTCLKHGQIVAILELMKIRMDIAFDGPDNAVFIKYLCQAKGPIRKNDDIFEYLV